MNLPQSEDKRGASCAMVEDTAKNLIEAKRLGMMTILISDALTDEDKPDYVDVVVRDVKQAIHAVMESNVSHEPTLAQQASHDIKQPPTQKTATLYDPV